MYDTREAEQAFYFHSSVCLQADEAWQSWNGCVRNRAATHFSLFWHVATQGITVFFFVFFWHFRIGFASQRLQLGFNQLFSASLLLLFLPPHDTAPLWRPESLKLLRKCSTECHTDGFALLGLTITGAKNVKSILKVLWMKTQPEPLQSNKVHLLQWSNVISVSSVHFGRWLFKWKVWLQEGESLTYKCFVLPDACICPGTFLSDHTFHFF